MPSTSVMFSAMAMIEPKYFVSVGSTWLRCMAACIRLTTCVISQRPAIQKMIAARILIPTSAAVVVTKVWIVSKSMGKRSGLKVEGPEYTSGHPLEEKVLVWQPEQVGAQVAPELAGVVRHVVAAGVDVQPGAVDR